MFAETSNWTNFGLISEGILVVNRAGAIVYANRTAEALFGYDEGELVHQSVEDMLPQSVRQRHVEHRQTYYAAPTARAMGVGRNLIALRKNGTEFPVEVSLSHTVIGDEAFVICLIAEISQRLRLEDELHTLSQVIRQSPVPIVITDIDGKIEYVNAQFTFKTGYSAEEALGQTPRILRSGHHSPEFYKEMWATIKSGNEWRGDLCNRKKDGELYWELTSIIPLRNAAGEITHFVAIKIDDTERRLAEEALQRSVVELDAFAHTVAHDLKNPLHLMLGYSRLMEEQLADFSDQEKAHMLGLITKTGTKMTQIIDELLLFANLRQLEEVPFTPLSMDSIVNEVCQRMMLMIENYEAEITLPDQWERALGYAPWVEQVWVNYISNAIKYGGKYPQVRLSSTLLPNQMVRFQVEDNGPGLAQENIPRLFQQFSRLEYNRAKGHGLGLSIVKRLVERLGGEVGVESEIGRGSIFSFTLPHVDRSNGNRP